MKLTKPKKRKSSQSYYDWREISQYIEKKYKCKLRDFACKFHGDGHDEDAEYQDFWHWMCEWNEISNGIVHTFNPGECLEVAASNPKDPAFPTWVISILTMFRDEFGDEFDVIFSW